MPYIPFYELFPKTAERETRSLINFDNDSFPKGEFGFIEMFCDECDCRRAVIRVVSPPTGPEALATISYGWGTRSFYERWGHGDEVIVESMFGVQLMHFAPQSQVADQLLEAFKNIVLADPEYEKRVRRHYSQFRKKAKKLELSA